MMRGWPVHAFCLGLWTFPALAAEPSSQRGGIDAAPEADTLSAGRTETRSGGTGERENRGDTAGEVDTKNLFGFTLGSDTLRHGRIELEGEGEGRIGRRTSRYEAGEPRA